jgi:hypothetical protein
VIRLPSPRPPWRIRYCAPREYALRVLFELAFGAGELAALRWVLPLVPFRHHQAPGLMSWSRPGQVLAVTVIAAFAVTGVALLRLRRGRRTS